MTYRFLSPAQADLSEAMQYYEQAVPGFGLEFLDEVERTVSRILLQPEAWKRVSEHHRRCRMRRFPYGLIYTMTGDEVLLISAVFDPQRHPESWRERK